MKLAHRFSSCDLYIFLWILYNLQGTLYASGSLISQVLLAVLLAWSVVNCFRLNSKDIAHTIYFRGLNVLILLFTIYGLLLIIIGPELYITEGTIEKVRNFVYLKEIYTSLLPIYSFFLFAKRGKLTEESLKKWFYIFIIIGTLQYVRSQRDAVLLAMMQGWKPKGITNNSGYIFVSLIPGLMLLRKKSMIQYLGLALCLFFIFASMKRGAIIVGVLSVILLFFYQLRYSSHRKKIGVVCLIILVSIASYLAVMYMLETNDYFNSRIQATLEGDSSHRDEIYSSLFRTFVYDTTFFQMLFGRGAWGTLTVSFNFAHNDWLEILTNQGLLGIIVFIYYWRCFLKNSKDINLSSESRICLCMILFICFMKTIFSMSYSDMSIYITSVLGLSLAGGIRASSKS